MFHGFLLKYAFLELCVDSDFIIFCLTVEYDYVHLLGKILNILFKPIVQKSLNYLLFFISELKSLLGDNRVMSLAYAKASMVIFIWQPAWDIASTYAEEYRCTRWITSHSTLLATQIVLNYLFIRNAIYYIWMIFIESEVRSWGA